jgi:hypothetical protein
MALGLLGETLQWIKTLNPSNRLTDIALRFEAYDCDDDGHAFPSGKKSPTYGGKWDTWAADYIGAADEENVLVLPCSERQLDYVLDDHAKTEAAGGRGAGKSEGGNLRALRFIVERPAERGRIISPTYDLTRVVWSKLLNQIPSRWLLPGADGIRRADRELCFRNGVVVQFRSAKYPDSLRSWGGGWTFLDEAQDITTEALDIAWPCLRESANPAMWMSLTPKPGEPFARHQEYLQDPEAGCFFFDSYSNPFISKRVFDLAAKRMDKQRFEIEVMANWDTVAKMEAEDGPKIVFGAFNREIHGVRGVSHGTDITAQVTRRKIGEGKKFIIGVDPNLDWPNYAVVYKVYSPLKSGDPNRWVATRVISAKGHCGHLGRRIKEAGFKASECVVVPDASSHYNGLYSSSGKSSARLLRAEGFTVKYPAKNPLVTDSVNDLLAKIAPAWGEPSWFLDVVECEELAEAMEAAFWNKAGDRIDKSLGVDHVIDAARYPVSYFEPAAKFSRKSSSRFLAAA